MKNNPDTVRASASWRAAAAYLYTLDLDGPALAWGLPPAPPSVLRGLARYNSSAAHQRGGSVGLAISWRARGSTHATRIRSGPRVLTNCCMYAQLTFTMR